MSCRSGDNKTDCGLYSMKHMETYMGNPQWKCGFTQKKQNGPAGNLRELNDGREREGSDAVDLSLCRYHVRPHFRLDVSGNGGDDNGGCNGSRRARQCPRDAGGQLGDFSHLLFPAWPPRQREPTTPLAAVEGEESEGGREALPNEEKSSPLLAIFIRREPTTPSAALFIVKASPEKCELKQLYCNVNALEF
nr:hypothetical protein SOVF_030300 [Ipomoea batatas]